MRDGGYAAWYIRGPPWDEDPETDAASCSDADTCEPEPGVQGALVYDCGYASCMLRTSGWWDWVCDVGVKWPGVA